MVGRSQIVEKALTMPIASKAIAALCAACLAFALIAQYGFDLKPCVLCLWQRVPYILAGVAALMVAFLKLSPRNQKLIMGFAALSFLINAGLAVFHTGVEQHWWLGTSGCTIKPLVPTTIDDIRTQLLQTVTARCDEIAWTFLGLSMTNYNIAISLALAAYAIISTLRTKT